MNDEYPAEQTPITPNQSQQLTSYGATNSPNNTQPHTPAETAQLAMLRVDSDNDIVLQTSTVSPMSVNASSIIEPWRMMKGKGDALYLPGLLSEHNNNEISQSQELSLTPTPNDENNNASTIQRNNAAIATTRHIQPIQTRNLNFSNSDSVGSPSPSPFTASSPLPETSPQVPPWRPPLPNLNQSAHSRSTSNLQQHHHKLGQFAATAICGNDITSSCLYMTGLVVSDAGIYAPLCLILVALCLYLYRKVYGEAITALPLNGGTYTVLLSSTSKATAATAGALTILSYCATGIVSAASAIEYLEHLFNNIPTKLFTILLLSLFAVLCLYGISESANIALAIFTVHCCTLLVLIFVSLWHVFNVVGLSVLHENIVSQTQPVFWTAVVFGFSSGMLGVSGFESSANFVEEQKEGVFILTLRNMWLAVAVFNPVISALCVCAVPVSEVESLYKNDILAELAFRSGGRSLERWVSIDAFLVLSGSVLTAFVGVTGLCRRLALDRCMPQFLLAENKWRKTNHWIIMSFLCVCISMYLMLEGEVVSLADVYSISFLTVMILFAIGNMLLKYKRARLQRIVKASWTTTTCAALLTMFALGGVIHKHPAILFVWLIYFLVTGFFIAIMFYRVQSLKILYFAIKHISQKMPFNFPCFIRNRRSMLQSEVHSTQLLHSHHHPHTHHVDSACLQAISHTIRSISSQAVAFFTKTSKLAVLNKAVLYVRSNEDCAHVRIVHIYRTMSEIPTHLIDNVRIIDSLYPKLKIDLVLVKGEFSPAIIEYLSHELSIPKTLMFISCPRQHFRHKLESLGGVRIITH